MAEYAVSASALWAVVACSITLGLPSAALAQPAPRWRETRLDYQRDPAVVGACPDEESFRHMLDLFTRAEDPFKADAAETVRVAVGLSGGAYRVTIAVLGPDGAQQGRPEEHTRRTCPEAAREAASTVYLLVAPVPVPPSEEPPPSPPPDPPPESPPPPSLPPARGARAPWRAQADCGTSFPPIPCPLFPPAPTMDVTIGLSTYVMMSAFLTAEVAPAVGLGVDVGGETFFGRLEVRGVLPGRAYAREVIPGATSDFPVEMDLSQITALLVPCARYKYFVGCGVAQFGVLLMNYELGSAREAAVAFGPRIGFEIPFAERFAVFGFGEVLFAANRALFEFSRPPEDHPDLPRANTQWLQPVASGFFGAGVAVKFK